jgi:hypothetical protein
VAEEAGARVGGKNNSNVYKLNVDMLERAAAEAKLFYATHVNNQNLMPQKLRVQNLKGQNLMPQIMGLHPSNIAGDPSMVEGDPSLDPSLDPSSKTFLSGSCGPDDKPDPEVVITDNAIEVLAHLNQVSGSRFRNQNLLETFGPVYARVIPSAI